MSTLEFVLPEGSPDPCPNACGGLTEDPYGGPCKACWAKVSREDEGVCGETFDHDEMETYRGEDGIGWECRRCGAEGWEAA